MAAKYALVRLEPMAKGETMGLSITITRRKEKKCPHCGGTVGYEVVADLMGGGRNWYPILEQFGYYVPHERRTEDNDWYGKDMVLTTEQVNELYRFSQNNDVYISGGLRSVVAQALIEGDQIVINADW